jgi:hypothetical protein
MSLVTGIALDANQDRLLELVATSLDKAGGPDALWHAWQTPTGDWTGWHQFGRPGEPAGYNPPTIARTGDGYLQIVVITTIEATVWHRRQTVRNDGWSPWQSLGRPGGDKPKSSPGVPVLGVNSAGRLEVFVVVEDQVWHAAQQPGSTWSAWSSMGQPGGDSPTALRW